MTLVLHGFNYAAELVGDVELMCVEEQDDEIDSLCEPGKTGFSSTLPRSCVVVTESRHYDFNP